MNCPYKWTNGADEEEGQGSSWESEPEGENAQTTPHLTHTRALFLAAHARTPDVITRLAQGLDDLFGCFNSHSLVMSLLNVRFLRLSRHLLPHCLTDATDWNQIRPPVQLRSGVDRLAIWPIRSQTQVMSPSSASMSVASTRRSTFRPET